MHEIVHILGICPDSFSHLDMLDLVMYNYNGFLTFIKSIIQFKLLK